MKEIRVNIKFFTLMKERIGENERTMLLAEGSTINHITIELKKQYPKLVKMIDCSLIALNEEYTSQSSILEDGDTIAIIPPVSGG